MKTWHHLCAYATLITLIACLYWFFARKLQNVEAQRDEARALLSYSVHDPLRPGAENWENERMRWLGEVAR